jgi:hypothetical protein
VLASHQTADWIAISVNLEPELTQNAGSIHENEFRTTLRTAMELASKRLSSLIGKRITVKETLAYVDHELEDVLDRYAELAWRQPFEKTQKALPQELQDQIYQEIIGGDMIVEIKFDWRVLSKAPAEGWSPKDPSKAWYLNISTVGHERARKMLELFFRTVTVCLEADLSLNAFLRQTASLQSLGVSPQEHLRDIMVFIPYDDYTQTSIRSSLLHDLDSLRGIKNKGAVITLNINYKHRMEQRPNLLKHPNDFIVKEKLSSFGIEDLKVLLENQNNSATDPISIDTDAREFTFLIRELRGLLSDMLRRGHKIYLVIGTGCWVRTKHSGRILSRKLGLRRYLAMDIIVNHANRNFKSD